MTLIDKIQQANSNKLSDYSRIEYPTAKVIEKIADDYAVEFAEWISKQEYNLDFWVRHNQTKNLLEIFKEEKGL